MGRARASHLQAGSPHASPLGKPSIFFIKYWFSKAEADQVVQGGGEGVDRSY